MSGPHVLCEFRRHDLRERGIDGSRSSVEFAVICIESITSLCWGGSSRAAVPGVCLALVQGSCSRKHLVCHVRESGCWVS